MTVNVSKVRRCQNKAIQNLSYCKACGLPLNEKTLANLARQQSTEQTQDKESLPYSSAFTYPLRGSGLTLLIISSLILGFIGMVPLGGLFSMGVSGYMAAFMFKIVVETARGNLEPVDWPDFNNLFDDILLPFFRMMFVNLFCFLPSLVMVYLTLRSATSDEFSASVPGFLIAGLLAFMGVLYLPLALLSVAMNGSILGVHPGIILRLLAHLRQEYLIVLVVLMGSIGLEVLCSMMLGGIPLFGTFLRTFIGLYFTMVNMHTIGLIYYKHREKML